MKRRILAASALAVVLAGLGAGAALAQNDAPEATPAPEPAGSRPPGGHPHEHPGMAGMHDEMLRRYPEMAERHEEMTQKHPGMAERHERPAAGDPAGAPMHGLHEGMHRHPADGSAGPTGRTDR